MPKGQTPEQRFWEKVNKNTPTGCWEWTGSKDTSGYGLFSLNNKMVKAHRFIWTLHNGKIPNGLCILHHCDNPKCVKISHLFIGDKKYNARDMLSKGRGNKATGNRNGTHTHPEKIKRGKDHWSHKYPHKILVGEQIGNSILTEREVLEIRKKYIPRKFSSIKLARIYNVSYRTIIDIINRKTWNHI